MAEELRPEGIPVTVGDVVITTPGLTGEVEVYGAGSPACAARSRRPRTSARRSTTAGMAEQLSVVVSQHQELTPGRGHARQRRRRRHRRQRPGAGRGQRAGAAVRRRGRLAVLAPAPTTYLPRPRPTGAVSGGPTGSRARSSPSTSASPPRRAASSGRSGKKVLKVLVFPLVDPILGKVGDHFAKRWEAKNRLNRVRWMTVDGYRSSVADAVRRRRLGHAARGPRAACSCTARSRRPTGPSAACRRRP